MYLYLNKILVFRQFYINIKIDFYRISEKSSFFVIYFQIKIKSLHTPPLKGAAQRGDIKHAHKNSSGRLPSKIGIALPDQIQCSTIRTPQYFSGFTKDYEEYSRIKNRSTYFDNESNTVTCIQFGDPQPVPFIQLCNSKIPELPAKTRSCASKKIQHRPSTAVNFVNYHYKNASDKEGNHGLTMKYFGESGNIIGCFTAARIPIQTKRPSTAIHHRTSSVRSIPRREDDIYKRLNGLVSLK